MKFKYLYLLSTLLLLLGCTDPDEHAIVSHEYMVELVLSQNEKVQWTHMRNTMYQDHKIKSASAFLFIKGEENRGCVKKFINYTAHQMDNDDYGIRVILLQKELDLLLNHNRSFEVFVVANTDLSALMDVPTRDITKEMLKRLELNNDFNRFSSSYNFAMYGGGDLKIEKSTRKVTTRIAVKRVATKLSAYVTAKPELMGQIKSIVLSFENGLNRTYLHTPFVPEETDYYTSPLDSMKKYDVGQEKMYNGKAYHYHMPLDFYSYVTNSHVLYKTPTLRMVVEWDNDESSEFETPINSKNPLQQNTWYKLFLSINTKGNPHTPTIIEPNDVEVVDWNEITDIEGQLGDGMQDYLEVLNPYRIFDYTQEYFIKYKSSAPLLPPEIVDIQVEKVMGKDGEKERLTAEDFDVIKSLFSFSTPTNENEDPTLPDYGFHGQVQLSGHPPLSGMLKDKYAFTKWHLKVKLHTEGSTPLENIIELQVNPLIDVKLSESHMYSVFVDGWRFPLSANNQNNKNECFDHAHNIYDNPGLAISHLAQDVTRNVKTPYGYITRPYFHETIFNKYPSPLLDIDVTPLLARIHIYSTNIFFTGNPRVPSLWTEKDLIPYAVPLNELGNKKNLWTNAPSIQLTSSSANEFAIVTSPDFLVSSLYGEVVEQEEEEEVLIDFETAQKRTATYQEAGYPAGRWRLPTEMEMTIISYVQGHKQLLADYTQGKKMLATERPYFLADGRVFIIKEYGGYEIKEDINKAYAKPIYDTFVWGIEPQADIFTYHSGN